MPNTEKVDPTVSVIVAVHNGADTIGDALESLSRQTFTSWEAIIVDDASTDETSEVVFPFLADPRFSYVATRTKSGSGTARNLAIERARGEFICILDADDICLPQRIEVQVRALYSAPDAVAVGGNIADFGDWGGPSVSSWHRTSYEIATALHAGKMPVPHCATMFRKKAVLGAGLYPTDIPRAEDFLLFMKLRDRKIISVPDVLVLYRKHRPRPFSYFVDSGRSGRGARMIVKSGRRPRHLGLPGSALVDLRSSIEWIRERLAG